MAEYGGWGRVTRVTRPVTDVSVQAFSTPHRLGAENPAPGDGRQGNVHRVRPRMITNWAASTMAGPAPAAAEPDSPPGSSRMFSTTGEAGMGFHALTLRAAGRRCYRVNYRQFPRFPRPRRPSPVGTSGELPSRATAEP